jgi:hypothetical protein
MRRVLAFLLPVLCGAAALTQPSVGAQPTSEGHPHKWETVDKSMVDFLDAGFELKAVVYDTAETGAKSDPPDVHYFLQKAKQLVRCDFRKREETSYYWCALLVRPK